MLFRWHLVALDHERASCDLVDICDAAKTHFERQRSRAVLSVASIQPVQCLCSSEIGGDQFCYESFSHLVGNSIFCRLLVRANCQCEKGWRADLYHWLGLDVSDCC